MSAVHSETETLAILDVIIEGRSWSRPIQPGERLFVGSEQSSDLCLEQAGVAPTHCAIIAASDQIVIEDCYTMDGTFVNNERIRRTVLTADAVVKIGSARFSIRLLKTPSTGSSGKATAAVARKTPVANIRPAEAPRPVPKVAAAELTVVAEASRVEELQFQLLEAREEIRVLQAKLDSSVRTSVRQTVDTEQQELIELLRAEVLDLRAALSEAEAGHVVQSDTESEADDRGVISRVESERLEERLEMLLGELQQRDEEIQRLNALLCSAEDTSHADREERVQMEIWVQEIEQRFGSREQEWRAEREELRKSLETAIAERDRVEAALNADSVNSKLEASRNVIQGLRLTAEALKQKLAAAEQANAELQQRLAETPSVQSREELVQLARERAELARQKQELESRASQPVRPGTDEAALRLRALRQHLNEQHAEEQAQREENKLSSRLARLWRRLEGR